MKRKRHQLSHDEPLCGGDLRLCGLFEDTPVAKHEIDANGVVVRVNQSECELLGYSPDEIIGKPVWALLRPKEQQESRDSVRRKFSGEQPLVPFEREYVRSDQTSVFVRIHESYIWNVHGAIVGLRSALLDITERKRDEELLRRQAIELQRSNAELEQFAYVVSHDLQEPLRMVASYTQLLARRYKGKLDSDADEFIAFAVDGAERMQRLIGDLLAYSRVGSREIEFRPVDSGAVVEEVLENLRLSISESGAVVSLDGLPAIQADPLQLGQLFQNLIGNALKFRGSRTPCLAVTAVEGEAEWQFCVQDNGIGIEPAHYERVFEVFRRLHTAKKYPGTGIGLAICKKIVERHGGRIWIDSTPGKGTRFLFTLAKTPGGVR